MKFAARGSARAGCELRRLGHLDDALLAKLRGDVRYRSLARFNVTQSRRSEILKRVAQTLGFARFHHANQTIDDVARGAGQRQHGDLRIGGIEHRAQRFIVEPNHVFERNGLWSGGLWDWPIVAVAQLRGHRVGARLGRLAG